MNIKMAIVAGLQVVLGICQSSLLAGEATGGVPLIAYSWPAQAGFSDRYRVFVQCGAGPESEVQTLMSRALNQGDYRAQELEGRTFSFVPLSYSPTAGPLRIRIVKCFGGPAESVTLHPRSYGLAGSLGAGGKEVVFQVATANRYFSVHFASEDNQTPKEQWIKHMLCVFVDPLETDVPARTAPGVVTYGTDVPPETLVSAKTVFFPAGHHNLRDYRRGGLIDDDGQLLLRAGQSLYLEGGAFVEGIVGQQNDGWALNQRVYGRGILSGRQYLWRRHPDHRGPEYRQLLKIGHEGRVDGITVMESPLHGIVGGTVQIANVKFLGWHCNNDGIRVWNGSEVSDSFLRAVDDHFYNFKMRVHDVVLWAGHNGSILTYGWGGAGTYRSGGAVLENIDIIHPEWTHLGNNNGLVMSQVGLDYAPFDGATTILRNIRIEGRVPGLLNLKPMSGDKDATSATPVAVDKVGYVGDLVLENVSADEQFARSRIRGFSPASTDGKETFYARNVQSKDLRIGGVPVTDANCREFFDIDAATTRDITFAADGREPVPRPAR